MEWFVLFRFGAGRVYIGLIEAVDSFDSEKGTRVTTYATKKINWAIKRAISEKADLMRMPEYLREEIYEFRKAQEETPEGTEKNVKTKRDEEIEALSKRRVISLDMRVEADGSQSSLYSTIVSPNSDPEEEVIFYQTGLLTNEAVERLPERERIVIQGLYGLGLGDRKTLKGLSKVLGVSKTSIQNIEKSAFDILGGKKAIQELAGKR